MSIRDLNEANVESFSFESDGSAYDLALSFSPDWVMWWNYTAFGTAASFAQGVWFKEFPAGDALNIRVIEDDGSTGDTNTALETTNGITSADVAASFANQTLAISGITAADPCVVTTSSAHGLSTGQQVVLANLVTGPTATGMEQLNQNQYKVVVLTTTTFSLQSLAGVDVDSSAFTAYVSGGSVTKVGPVITYQNSEPVYAVTLGTSVVGSDGDVIYVIAGKSNKHTNLGDVA